MALVKDVESSVHKKAYRTGFNASKSIDDVDNSLGNGDQDIMHHNPYQDHQEVHISSELSNPCNPEDDSTNHIEEEIVSWPPGTLASTDAILDDNDATNANINEMMSDNDTPPSAVSISTDPNTHSSQHNRNDNNTEEYTKGQIYNTIDGIHEGEDSDNFVDENEDDEGFDSNANSDTGDWGDFNESAYDGQDCIDIKEDYPHPPDAVYDELATDPTVINDGKSRSLKSITGRVDYRAWICEYCHALNNLMYSMKRNYKCVRCEGKYRPGQALIQCKEQDDAIPAIVPLVVDPKEQQHVWGCSFCSGFTPVDWNYTRCRICANPRPSDKDLFTFYTSDIIRRPYKLEDNVEEAIVKYKGDSEACRTLKGIAEAIASSQDPLTYPLYNNKIDPKLRPIFGKPYRNTLFSNTNNQWLLHKINGMINMQRQKVWQIPLQYIQLEGQRSIAINEKNGYIVMVNNSYIVILSPKGGTQYTLDSYSVHSMTVTSNSRVRFVGEYIYVTDYGQYTTRITVFNFSEREHTIYFETIINEGYFGLSRAVDFTVIDNLLIVLCDQLIGIYKLKRNECNIFKTIWYQSVKYSRYAGMNPKALEMCGYDEVEVIESKEEVMSIASIKNYMYILCEGNILSFHPSNPTYEYLHHAKNVDNGASFCNSRKYGTFWINKEGDTIYQSSKCNKDFVNIVCSLSGVRNCSGINWKQPEQKIRTLYDERDITNQHIRQFDSIVYDEGYGISGRLLIKCTANHNGQQSSMFYQLFNEKELEPLQKELQQSSYKLKRSVGTEPFNFVVFVFGMLYGSDLIENRL